jgi:hypothetical protein
VRTAANGAIRPSKHRSRIECALAASFVAVIVLFASNAAPSRIHAATNYIQTENAKPGTSDWRLTNPGYNSGTIEGYASATSVSRGEQIRLYVNTKEPGYSMDIFRMGYYQGLAGRRMMPTINRTGTAQPSCPMDPSTGMIECAWLDPYVLSIPGGSSDPTDWMSGIYLVKLTASVSGKQQYIIFAVRDDARASDLLMQQSVATYQAYNRWGGTSLYGTIQDPGDTANKAMKVSFDRPYYADNSNGQSDFFTDAYKGWEFDMVQWLEKEGYDVSYATSVDVDANPNLLLTHKAFLSVGHDEYWSWNMRDNVERARDAGVNLGFFSGNTSYWQVRFESGIANPTPGRVMVGYKEFWQQDPITPDQYKTTRWRDSPVNRSEDAMRGVRFVTQARPPFVVEDASHWVFTGTGLKNGDRLLNPDGSSFLGPEIDSMGPFSPPNTQRLAHSPANNHNANFDDMTVYVAPSGATVFDIGSIGWSSTVPQIQQITRNVLSRFVNGAFSETVPIRPSLPSPFQAQDIGDVGRPGFVAAATSTSFTLNGAGVDAPFAGQDALYFAYQPLSGDGQIIVRLQSLQNYWDNRAGVMIRESLSPSSREVALLGRPSESAGAALEGAELRVKDVAAGKLARTASVDQALPNWLRLARVGDTFTASISADGATWTLVGSASVAMASNVYIGAMVASSQHGVWATAMFDNVSVTTGGSSSQKCTSVTLSTSSFYSGAPESNWTIRVTAPTTTCTWTATSDSSWLLVTSTTPSPPVGSGSVRARAITNTGPFRTGHLTIGGVVYTVKQEAGSASPTDTMQPSVIWSTPTPDTTVSGTATISASASDNVGVVGVQFKLDGVNLGVEVTSAPYSITWNTASTSDGSHTLSATARDAAGNTATASATVTVANATSCSAVTLSKTSFYSGAPESNWKVLVTAPSGCAWTVTPDVSWIVISGASGVGSGSFNVKVLTNTTGVFRTGHFTIAGATYTVKQEQ